MNYRSYAITFHSTFTLFAFCVFNFYFLACESHSDEDFCPRGCSCGELNSVECESLDFTLIPSNWPSSLKRIFLKNCSIATIEKNGFRKFRELVEIGIDRCPNLDVIDKFAFKGLKKLRHITITRNPKLRELFKNAFAAIGNENSLSISIKGNAIERIRSQTFRNAHDLRELNIEEKCFEVESNAFSGVEKIDFLNIKGACAISPYAFQNASRIHNIHIADSSLDVLRDSFSQLYHVNQIQFTENRIGQIESDAFSGLFTVGSIHFQSNQIGQIEPRAFVGAENVGSLTLSYNNIRNVLESPDTLLNDAQRFVFTENNLFCTCEIRWIQHHYQLKDQTLLLENYCGREEAYKALSYYKPIGCPPLPLPSAADDVLGSTISAANPARQGKSPQASTSLSSPEAVSFGERSGRSRTSLSFSHTTTCLLLIINAVISSMAPNIQHNQD